MFTKKLICLLLALVLAVLCFAGCRAKKEEPVDDGAVAAPVTEPADSEQPEAPQQIEVIDNLTDTTGGLEMDDGELIIEVPEGMEIGGN